MLEDVDTDAEGNLDFESFKKIMSQTMGATDINKEMREVSVQIVFLLKGSSSQFLVI